MAEQPAPTVDRGRDATHPGDIPAAGWRDVFQRVRRRLGEGNLSITAAGAAFFALIATFPGLLALSAVYGLLFDRGEMAEQLRFLQGQLQPRAMELLVALMQGLSASDRSDLGFGVAGATLGTVWGASLGIRALMRALNSAYGERERRSFVQRNAVAVLLTLGTIAMAFAIGIAIVSVPIAMHWFPLASAVQRFAFYARWPVVAVLFWLLVLVFYRYGPSRAQPKWAWVSWGALLATALWLAGSAILAWYVAGLRSYQYAYGSVGSVVLVLAWYLLSAFAILLGAEVNAELERQTERDTTVGDGKPAGERGAVAADTVGESAQ